MYAAHRMREDCYQRLLEKFGQSAEFCIYKYQIKGKVFSVFESLSAIPKNGLKIFKLIKRIQNLVTHFHKKNGPLTV